jgi:hypothetical protein
VPSEEVIFDSSGCAIAGTFTETADAVDAALLITGDGRTDRNSDAAPGRTDAAATSAAGMTVAVGEVIRSITTSRVRDEQAAA